MLNRTRYFVALLLAVASIAPLLLSTPGEAQTRHVYLEEFTGAWCGFCPRGAYAIQKLYETYPGQVVVVSIHNDQNNPVNDMMDIPQGDSLVADVGFPAAEALQGFPDGWTARSVVQGTNWNIDPSQWATGVASQFGVSATDGVVSSLLAEAPAANVTLDSITYDDATHKVTARVTATFDSALTGDFRLNIMVTEDSVSGSGPGWDQHNYYSSAGSVGPSLPNNPMYNYPPSIPGFEHMHVFREAVGGIHGVAGIVPNSPVVGTKYSKTFTFTLPSNIQNKYYVHLIGMVNQYSATDPSGNEVFDAMELPLINTPHAPNQVMVSADNGQYTYAHAGGDTSIALTVSNGGSTSTTVNLTVSSLPTGWSATFTPPSPLTLGAGATQHVVLKLTSPEQSSFVAAVIQIAPQEAGVYIHPAYDTVYALSDNTQYAVLYDPSTGATSAETAMVNGLPDSMKLHAAVIPMTGDVLQAYPPENYSVSIYNNINILDNGQAPGISNPTVLPDINASLAAGKKVFINSDLAMGYAFDQTDGYFSQFAGYTETSDVQSFYQQLGLDWTKTVRNWNPNTGQLLPFSIKGTANDPIGNGISVNDAGGFMSEIFSIDSNSAPVFYTSGSTKNVIGARYVDAATGARLVYLGFGLSEITNQTQAATIARNSIAWLMSNSSDAVSPIAAGAQTAITASPNPFHGMTEVQYTAAPGERNVTLAAYDLLGREVAKLPVTNSGNVYSANFDGSKLSNGTYVIIAHSSAGMHEVRVVDQE